jgi:hypothetical protein
MRENGIKIKKMVSESSSNQTTKSMKEIGLTGKKVVRELIIMH